MDLPTRTLLYPVFLVLAALLLAMPAHAVSMLDPFNIPGTMDWGVEKLADGLPYADDPRLKLDVYAPAERDGAAPVVVFIYGGGWSRGERTDYQFVGHALAARGYVTVIPDYRLVPNVRFPAFIEDAAKAVHWVENNIAAAGGDPNRVFLAGHSAGAYIAVMLGLDKSYLAQAGVTVPIRGVAGLSGPYDFYPFEYGEVVEAFGNAAVPEATQPVNMISGEAPPFWLGTGTHDFIVRAVNTENLAKGLNAYGVPVTVKYYEGLAHMEPVMALSNVWRWRVPVLDDMTAFFGQYGSDATPVDQPVDLMGNPPPPAPTGPSPEMQDVINRLDAVLTPIN